LPPTSTGRTWPELTHRALITDWRGDATD
jgi:hypothetical protein